MDLKKENADKQAMKKAIKNFNHLPQNEQVRILNEIERKEEYTKKKNL